MTQHKLQQNAAGVAQRVVNTISNTGKFAKIALPSFFGENEGTNTYPKD